MFNIVNSHPEEYEEFFNGNFEAQLSKTNPFGKMELDKVREVTINRDTKTLGGTTSFSRSNDAVNKWSLNALYRADMRRCLHKMLKVDKKTIHSDLTTGRIKKGFADLRAVRKILTETFLHPFTDSPLLCISNGAVATDQVSSNISNAKMIGKTKCKSLLLRDYLEKNLCLTQLKS